MSNLEDIRMTNVKAPSGIAEAQGSGKQKTQIDLSAIPFAPEKIKELEMLQNKHLKARTLIGFLLFVDKMLGSH